MSVNILHINRGVCCSKWGSFQMLLPVLRHQLPLNTLMPRQNGRNFADDTSKPIFLIENIRISIMITLKFDPKIPINDIPALLQIMTWRRPGDKPLSGPMMVCLLTHICVTRPHWVNDGNCLLIMPMISIKERRACDLLPESTKIFMFKCNKSNCTTMRHVYNESAKFPVRYVVQFDINGPSNLIEIVPVICGRVLCNFRAEFRPSCYDWNMPSSWCLGIHFTEYLITNFNAPNACHMCLLEILLLIISTFPWKHNKNGTDSDHLCKHPIPIMFWSIKAYIIFTFDFWIARWYVYSRKLLVDKLTTQFWCEVCNSGHMS